MIPLYRISSVCVVLLLVVIGGSAALAADSAVETMIKTMPEDAIAFAAFGGGDTLKGDFEKSTPGRIWNDPGVQSFYQSVKTQLRTLMQKEAGDPNEVKRIDMALGLAQLAAGRPILLGVASLKGPIQENTAPVYGFAVLDAGDRKLQFEAAVKQVETLIGLNQIIDASIGSAKVRRSKYEDDTPLYWGWLGNYLVVAINDANGLAMQHVQKPRAALPGCLAKVPGGGNALVAHFDIAKAVGLIEASVRETEGAEEAKTVSAVMQGLGLSGVKTTTLRAGFAGPDIVAGTFLEASAPRTGLLAAFKPVDPAMMDLVDARAIQADAVNIDAAAIYDTIVQTIKTVAGEDFADVEKGLADFEARLKVNIRKDLLGNLAGPVVFYSVGAGVMPGSPNGGFAAFIKLKDAATFEKAATSLAESVAARSEGALQVTSQTRDDGRTVHTWIVPPLAMTGMMPAWSVVKDYAVVGSNAAVYDAMVAQMTAANESRKSIRDTQAYKETVAKLPDNLLTLSYTDTATEYTQLMAGLQQLWPMATMFAAQKGITLPAMLPQLGPIIKDMRPLSRLSWAQPDGLYSLYRGPSVDIRLTSVAGVSAAAGILMPALVRTRQLAFRMTSGTNLAGIGKACLVYTQDHDDKLPPDLQSLVKDVELSPKALESKLKPAGFAGPSYIYIAGQTTAMDPRNVVAYDNPEFCSEGVNVLFLDSHVEFMKPDRFREVLEATFKRLGRPVPEIRFKGEKDAKPPTSRPASPPSIT